MRIAIISCQYPSNKQLQAGRNVVKHYREQDALIDFHDEPLEDTDVVFAFPKNLHDKDVTGQLIKTSKLAGKKLVIMTDAQTEMHNVTSEEADDLFSILTGGSVQVVDPKIVEQTNSSHPTNDNELLGP